VTPLSYFIVPKPCSVYACSKGTNSAWLQYMWCLKPSNDRRKATLKVQKNQVKLKFVKSLLYLCKIQSNFDAIRLRIHSLKETPDMQSWSFKNITIFWGRTQIALFLPRFTVVLLQWLLFAWHIYWIVFGCLDERSMSIILSLVIVFQNRLQVKRQCKHLKMNAIRRKKNTCGSGFIS
jgi:hypothetical protein